MSNACNKSLYFSGQGAMLMGERDSATGKPVGLRPVGNLPTLALGIATTVFEHKESCTGVRGTDLQITQEISATMDFTFESIDKENLAVGLYGESGVVALGTVTDEPVKGYHGLWMPLDNISVDTVVMTDTAGTTTYTIETDYLLNADTGSFMALATGAITDGEDLKVSYGYAAQNNVDALTTGSAPDRWIRFEGLNTAAENKPVVIDAFRVNTQPLAALALIQDELASMEISAKILSDALRTSGSKFFRVRYI